MANGFVGRVLGKTKIGTLWLGSTGGLTDSKSGQRLGVGVGVRLAMTVPSQTNTDFTFSLPAGASVASLTVFTTTAFGAVTDAKISIGSSAGDASYVAATSIKAAGVVLLSPAASTAAAGALLSAPAGSPNFFVRIAQSGGNSATGAATLVVDANLA